jgi:hypothetical protein
VAEATQVVEPAGQEAPDRAVAAGPHWRATLRRSVRCWFGGVVLIVAAIGPLLAVGEPATVPALVGLLVAAALLSTLGALVIESLSGRAVPIRAHVLLGAVALGIVVALLTLSPAWATIGVAVGGAAAALGALLTAGRPTWRRFAAALGAAVALAVLIGVVSLIGR